MPKSKSDDPENVNLTYEQANELKERIIKSPLSESDKTILVNVLSFQAWLQKRLSYSKMTIKRLKKLFGFKSEARKKSSAEPSANDEHKPEPPPEPPTPNHKSIDSSSTTIESQKTSDKTAPKWDETQNHGRYGATDYPG